MSIEYAKLISGSLTFLPASLAGHKPAALVEAGWKPLVTVQHAYDPETHYTPGTTIIEEADRIVVEALPIEMPEDKRLARLESIVAPCRGPALVDIDERAGKARLALASTGAFQSAEYERAAAQAEACLAGGAGPFKALEADVAAGTVDPRTGQAVTSVTQAAGVVRMHRAAWEDKLDEIRMTRLTAKAAVRAARTPEEVKTVVSGLPWPF